MLVHNDRIALGGVRGDKFIFGAIRGDKQLFDTSVITDANKEYILATYGEEALAKALVYLHGNPSFIPFFNEDPDTICSVCEIGWFRGIKTPCLLLPDIKPDKYITYDFMAMVNGQQNTCSFLGIKGNGGTFSPQYNYGYYAGSDYLVVNSKLITARHTHPKDNIPYRYECDFYHVKITKQDDGMTEIYDTNIADDYIFPEGSISINGITDDTYMAACYFFYFIAKKGKTLIHLIPFKDSNGKYYLLDLLTYKKYAAATIADQETKMKL